MIDLCQRVVLAATCLTAGLLLLAQTIDGAPSPGQNEARVTRIVRDVKLLPANSQPEPAGLNDKVSEGTGVRTGDKSRSELTFVNLTIERLGSNTLFSFQKAGQNVLLPPTERRAGRLQVYARENTAQRDFENQDRNRQNKI